MPFLLAILTVFLLILGLVCVSGLVIGFVLHWVIPSIGFDLGTLIGVAAIGVSGYFFLTFASVIEHIRPELDLGEGERLVIRPLKPPRAPRRKSN